MNKVLICGLLLSTLISGVGCTTKSYVRKQVTPLINKVNELDERTAENTKGIKDLDARTQQGMQASTLAEQSAQKAADADNQAQKAEQSAIAANTKVNSLSARVANLDTYHVVAQTQVVFHFDQADLNPEAKEALDQFMAQLPASRGYIVVVKGGTDTTGNEEYNYDLSRRRATQVVRYLAAKYDVPPYKVYAIGVGEDKPVAPNNTSDGRKVNRRAEVQIMSNTGQQPASQAEPDFSGPNESEEFDQGITNSQ